MLEHVLRSLKNWFLAPGGIHSGRFAIQNGGVALPFLKDGQYFRIVGSARNDGVYRYGTALALEDEEFQGAVWALAIPRALLELTAEIEQWQARYGAAAAGPYQSESFGGYAYTRATAAGGGAITWESAFQGRLNAWRKL